MQDVNIQHTVLMLLVVTLLLRENFLHSENENGPFHTELGLLMLTLPS